MAGLTVQTWCCYDTSGTTTLLNDLNVDSLVDNGAGDTTVNITTDYPNNDYALAGMCMKTGAVSIDNVVVGLDRQGTDNPSVGSVRIELVQNDEGNPDCDFVGVVMSGD